MSVLIDLENNNDGSYSKFLIANGFDVRLIQGTEFMYLLYSL